MADERGNIRPSYRHFRQNPISFCKKRDRYFPMPVVKKGSPGRQGKGAWEVQAEWASVSDSLLQRVVGKDPLFNGMLVNQMLLHKLGNALGCHAVIPGSLGIDHHGGAMTTDAQTAHLGAVTRARTGAQIALLHLLLERFPRLLANLRRTAIGS